MISVDKYLTQNESIAIDAVVLGEYLPIRCTFSKGERWDCRSVSC